MLKQVQYDNMEQMLKQVQHDSLFKEEQVMISVFVAVLVVWLIIACISRRKQEGKQYVRGRRKKTPTVQDIFLKKGNKYGK